jgi:hypothetical protein
MISFLVRDTNTRPFFPSSSFLISDFHIRITRQIGFGLIRLVVPMNLAFHQHACQVRRILPFAAMTVLSGAWQPSRL